jgi:Cu+-exporting ATPase
MSTHIAMRPRAGMGLLAFGLMLGVYFGALTLVSGWTFTFSQFSDFWYYIVPLAAGFGVQVALFMQLRRVISSSKETGTVLAASGTTSTAAMVSCCAHYLANVAPVLGATGLVAFAVQFQVELFWVGLAFNLAGIAYIGSRLLKASREHARCLA